MDTTALQPQLEALLARPEWSRERLASELGVSVATITRWTSGSGRPRATAEGRLRGLLAADSPPPTTESADTGDARIRAALAAALNEARESLHRHARISSRHEALDEICKLLFAQIILARDKSSGLSEIAERGAPAVALSAAVSDAFATHLPRGLAEEMPLSEFELRLRPAEDELAVELAHAFERITPDLVASAEHHDVFNEVFGTFLADSFGDERQLGQYLTPPEVVRFMVEVAVQTLTDEHTQLLRQPAACGDFGLVLDPSCGVGSFLTTFARRVATAGTQQERQLHALSADVLVGVDKSERMMRLALTSFALLGADRANLHLANSLGRNGQPAILDEMVGRVRLILTNPPFGAEFHGKAISGYALARSASKVDSELLFVERYLDWLMEDGVALVVVPDSVLTNRGIFRDLRDLVAGRGQIESVVSLPSETFAAAGTGTKTSVLHVRKSSSRRSGRSSYVARCEKIGFGVSTRASYRRKIARGTGQLPTILDELTSAADPVEIGRRVVALESFHRWDATYHASLPPEVEALVATPPLSAVFLLDVAVRCVDRTDPRRSALPTFDYIEISDVDGSTGLVQAKPVPCSDAPSRARKRVQSGDVLISTVRPERRAVGVVPERLENAICSTGFAVLRPQGVDPTVLAALLRTDFVTAQLMRNNMGVAYPAVDESCVDNLLLPIERGLLETLGAEAERVRQAQDAWHAAQQTLAVAITDAIRAFGASGAAAA